MRVFKLLILLMLLHSIDSASDLEIEFQDGTASIHRSISEYVKNHDTSGLADSLSLLLTDYGFLDNSIIFKHDDSSGLVTVTLGHNYDIGEIIFEEDLHDTLICNLPLTRKNVESIVDSVIQTYQSNGFYFASMTPSEYEKRKHYVDVHMNFRMGPVVTISSIELEGIRKTNPEFLMKYISARSGDTLYAEKIHQSLKGIKRLDFISLNGPPEIIPDAGYRTARVSFSFTERKQFNFEGAAGYITEGDGYLVWFLNFKGRNIFRGGQKVGLIVDNREKNKSVFSVLYGQPVFLVGVGEAILNLQTRDFRDQFYEFSLGLSYDINLKSEITIRSYFGWKNVEPADTALRSFQVFEAGIGVRAGEVEEVRGAAADFAVDWEMRYSGRRYRQKENAFPIRRSVYNDTRNEISITAAFPLISFISDYHRLDFKDIESSERPLPVSELFLLGGPSTLRGYRNDQFSAQRFVLLKSELRFFVSKTDFFYPFLDGAYFEKYKFHVNRNVAKEDDFKWGYGIGFRLSSENHQLNIGFSWGEEADFSEPRLNVTIANQF